METSRPLPDSPSIDSPHSAEQDLVRFFELSLDLFAIARFDGFFVRVNSNFTRLLGFPEKEFITRPFLDFVHPGDHAATIYEMSKLSSGLPVVQFRNRYRDIHGDYHWLEWNVRSVVEAGVVYGVARDVTDAKLAEAQRIARIGSWEWRVASNQNWWSDEYYRIFGFWPGQVRPTRESFLERIHPDDLRLIEHWLESVQDKRTPDNFEFRIIRLDGAERTLWSETRIELDAAGELTRVVGTVQDVTEQKLAQAERRLIEQKLLEAQKLESLSVLTGGIAHDFNNLLAAILGSASDVTARLPSESPLRASVDKIVQASERAAGLCRQMLAYSGRGQFVLTDVDVNATLGDLLQLLKGSIGKKAAVKLTLADELPPVRADATQLGQVLMNLLINASEAIGDRPGEIRIATRSRLFERAEFATIFEYADLPAGHYVWLEIADTGCGMDDATRRKIFEPFFSTKFAGRGLGLAATLGIVRGHRGAIRVVSEKGTGTTFHLLLPAQVDPAAVADTARPVAAGAWEGEGKVLIADDDDLVRESTAQMLQTLGFETVLCADGEDALKHFRAAPDSFRFALLDLTMPKLDGVEAFQTLHGLRPKLPVILMSGYNTQDAAGRYSELGLAGFLAKPFRLQDLASCIRRALGVT